MEPLNTLDREHPRLGEGIYTISDIARICKIPQKEVRYLTRYYLKGKFGKSSRFDYRLDDKYNVFNFKSLIEINVFYLWKKHGVPTKRIVNAHEILAKKYFTKYPLALKNISIAGSDIVEILNDNFYLKVDGTGQPFLEIIKPFLKKVVYDENNQAIKLYPLGKDGHIVVDPKIQFGQPVIEGTRITVENIALQHKAGDSIEVLSKLYNLQPRKLKKSIEFYNRAA